MSDQSELRAFLVSARASELRARSAAAAIASLLLAAIFELTVFPGLSKLDPVNLSFAMVLGLLQFVRYRHAKVNNQEPVEWLKTFSAINFLIALSWAALLSHAAWLHQGNTAVTSLIFIVCGGLIAAAAYSLSISKYDFLTFQSLILSTYFFSVLMDASYAPVREGALAIGLLFFLFLVRQRKLWSQFWHEQSVMHFELQRILDAFPGGISVIDHGVYKRVNKYISDTVLSSEVATEGGSPLVGRKVLELKPRSEVGQEIRDYLLIEGPRPRCQREVMLDTPSGPRTHLLVMDQLVGSDRSDEVVAITIDIHEQKKTQQELEQQRQLFINKSKMAALGEMSSGLAHEINNPLTIIGGRILQLKQLLKAETLNLEKISQTVSNIEKTTERIAKVIRGLRTFARDASGDPFEKSDLNQIIKETADLCESRFKNFGVELKISVPDHPLSIECQATQVSQVILNALNNAFDAIQYLEREKWIEVKAEIIDSKAFIRVTDCGDGIPQEIRDKILNPFFTTKPVGKGTGLGLSLSLGLVELHGGSLSFNHEHPHTQLVIELPVEQKKGQRPQIDSANRRVS